MNSAALATITHKRLKGVSDGTGTQVGIQMINKCRIKMAQIGLYNVRDPYEMGIEKGERENTVTT